MGWLLGGLGVSSKQGVTALPHSVVWPRTRPALFRNSLGEGTEQGGSEVDADHVPHGLGGLIVVDRSFEGRGLMGGWQWWTAGESGYESKVGRLVKIMNYHR